MAFAWSNAGIPKPASDASYADWRNYVERRFGFSGSRLTQETRRQMSSARPPVTDPVVDPVVDPVTDPVVTDPGLSEEDSLVIAENLIYQLTGIRGLGEYYFGLTSKGYTPDDVMNFLRYGNDPDPANKRFYDEYQRVYPGMTDFLQRGIFGGGMGTPEEQYRAYRTTVREAAKAYGINDSLVDDQSIYNYINAGNSAETLVSRMGTAAAAVATTPPETMAILKDYYNLSTGDLISFYLDTDKTEAELTKRLVTAQIGTEAAAQQFGIDVATAENIVQRGYTQGQARTAFETAAAGRSFTAGPGETATEKELIGAEFGDTEAVQKIARVAGSRAGRFAEGGGYAAGQTGVSGLGAATTR